MHSWGGLIGVNFSGTISLVRKVTKFCLGKFLGLGPLEVPVQTAVTRYSGFRWRPGWDFGSRAFVGMLGSS